jgi:hypothetical protein
MTPEMTMSLLTNVGFPTGLLVLSYFAVRGAAAFLKPWMETIFKRIIGWFDAQTELVKTLKTSLDETAVNVENIARTQEILARGQRRANLIWERVVGVMEGSPCVARKDIEMAKREYDSDDFTDKEESSSDA